MGILLLETGDLALFETSDIGELLNIAPTTMNTIFS